MTEPKSDTCVSPCAKCEVRSRRSHRLRRAGLRWFVALSQRIGGPALDIERARLFWAEPCGESGGLVYVALGDSVAQGLGGSTPATGYVGLLAERLRAAGPVQVVNLSASGARIQDVVDDQLPRLRALDRVDVVTLDIGGNDVRRYDPVRFEREITALLAGVPAGTIVADLPYFMHGHWERDALVASRLLREAAGLRGLPVVPLHAVLAQRGWKGMFGDYAADFFHPNDRGHRVWADAFWPQVSAASRSNTGARRSR
jgi:acyl-CoA thioesterase-1